MGFTRRQFLAFAGLAGASGLAGCSRPTDQKQPDDSGTDAAPADVDLEEFKDLAINMESWKYDEENDCYYQLGLKYCTKPATKTYESLAIFVPGKFFTGEKSGSAYKCSVNEKAVVGNFTPATAPVVMPVNTGTLAAQQSPTTYEYTGLGTYLEQGCVYVYAGFRGRSAGVDTTSGSTDMYPGGAPWPVVDLKAAVRYLRYNASELPFDVSRVFVFGFSAGGGVSAVMGASGDAEAYRPYLESIGAATHDAKGAELSDAIAGSASWCPVTSFDVADAAYEWAMGQHSSADPRAEGTWRTQLSQGLAGAYGAWVNGMDLRNADDEHLTLDESEGGQYTMGSYADELLSQVSDAATYFVQNTPFPYTHTPQHLDDPMFPGDPNLLSTRASAQAAGVGGAVSAADTAASAEAAASVDVAASVDAATGEVDASASDAAASQPAGTTTVQSTIYDTPSNYFAALNSDYRWINYNIKRNVVTVQSLGDLSKHVRPAEMPCSPYDRPDRSSKSNQLFGIGEESTLHFDAMAGELIEKNASTYATCSDWDASYESAWRLDLAKQDSLETTMAARVDMMNPLYWLSGAYAGYGQSGVAAHWRINEGVFDTFVSPCTAANMALALGKYDGVSDVAYTPVWGQGHVLAERSGSPAGNFVAWVVSCCS
ncbi:subtype A tannase [Paratractidigestivibacter sp.]|uniref:subtype A tannase n=1 Tax=Paratractidigestivibacter sp. TaxID=2847316 RepID=UPI002ABE6434|nr:subtype A tannase [Paratractidigestivibacter sp.]